MQVLVYQCAFGQNCHLKKLLYYRVIENFFGAKGGFSSNPSSVLVIGYS